jgi:hypothetical protein
MENIKRNKVIFTSCLLAFLLVAYFCVNTRCAFRFYERTDILNYNMLAEAVLAGQTHLKQEVHPGRLGASDPCDPTLPYPCIFDAIIFDGKYYFLQQPLPALVHAAWIALTGSPLSTGVVVVLAAFGSLIWVGLILWRVRKFCFPESPEWIFWFCWLSFALSGAQLYMVSRQVVYHESIAVGVFFALGGTAVLINALTRSRPHWSMFGISGLFFGAAVASRITLILWPVCCAACVIVYYFLSGRSLRTNLTRSFLVLFPVALFVLALLFYNFVRFGDWLDFGRKHMTIPSIQAYSHFIADNSEFGLKYVPYNLYLWLLSLPQVKWYFDVPALVYPSYTFQAADVLLYRERVASIFTMAPALLLVLATPALFNRSIKGHNSFFVIYLCSICSLVMFIYFLTFFAAIGRYLYEFAPLLFALVLCNTALLWQRLAAHPRARGAFKTALGILFVLNCLAGIALGVNGMVQP